MNDVIEQKPRLVMKFGGTSVRDLDHIKRAAQSDP
jgi:aspartokinase